MTLGTYLLVVLSAAAHAYWNALLKRTGGSQSVVAMSKVIEAIGLGGLLAAGVTATPQQVLMHWMWPAVGALLVLGNYAALAAAYRHGDLSLVYPISRGAMLVFVPPFAAFAIGERLDPAGRVAIAIIVAGIVLLPARGFGAAAIREYGRAVAAPATLFSLGAALFAACYTVWDKQAVQVLSPLGYFAGYTVLLGVVYAGLLLRSLSPSGIARAWRAHRGATLQIAALNSASYLLALVALQGGKASYVIALRQLSIAGGALLGHWLLGEELPGPRVAGIALVVAGCALLGLAN